MSKEKMTIQEEEKFKDDMMKQAEDMIKKGEVTKLKEGEWQETPLDNPDILTVSYTHLTLPTICSV